MTDEIHFGCKMRQPSDGDKERESSKVQAKLQRVKDKRILDDRRDSLELPSDRMDVKNLDTVKPFRTKDGSEIRELLAHRNSVIRNQSLAEARLEVGSSTQEHYHPKAEEIYYITHGTGRMRIEGETREVKAGDAIAIPPGKRHKLWNTGTETLRLLCCCAPGYEDADTVMIST
jgi:mannose-6-phosphate isomerase-like protein (cupin superfamily)